MATSTIPNLNDVIEVGSVTAANGYTVSSVNIKKIGRICCVSFAVTPSGSGTIPTATTTLATIQDGFRPAQMIETSALSSSKWWRYLYKAKIYHNGDVQVQGAGDGSGEAAWINIVATYIT